MKAIAILVTVMLWGFGAHAADFTSRTIAAEDRASLIVTEGTVRVPESRTGAASDSIELAVVRIARSTTPSASAHVILAGGPGDSGVSLVLGLARRGGAPLLDMFDGDIVGIDQRGTGASVPNLRAPRAYGLPLDQPGTPQAWLPLIEKTSREVAAEFSGRGIHLESYNTRESADDIDAVRRALGYERITLWGRSYGSHLALATLRRHAKTIERVILANPEGPDHTFKLPSEVDAVLERMDELVAMDLLPLMRDVLGRLERAPVHVEVPHPLTSQPVRVGIGRFDLQWLTAQALGDPRTAGTIPVAYLEMSKGDFHRVAQLVIVQRSRMGGETAMKQMMDLSSGATATRRTRIEREAVRSLLGNAINFPLMSLGNAWGNPDLGDEFRQPVRSDVPVLILAGDLDPRTPVENGRDIVKHLPNGHLVVLENAGHQFDLFGSPQIRELLEQFLHGRKVTTRRLEVPAPRFTSPG